MMPVSGTVDGQVFEMKDIIQWLREEAEAKGELNWGENENIPELAEFFASHPEQDFGPRKGDPDDVDAEIRAEMQAYAQEEHRKSLERAENQRRMDLMKPLVVHTEKKITKKLLAFGLTKRELALKSLREKVIDLTHLEDPRPKNFIRVWVDCRATTGKKDLITGNLPVDESVLSICKTLEYIINLDIAGEGRKQIKGGQWKYQLVSRDFTRVINKASVYLKTNDDYQTLVKSVKRNGKKVPQAVAVLTQVKPPDTGEPEKPTCIECSESGEIAGLATPGFDKTPWSEDEDDYVMDEPLDEDGNPIFEPWDAKKNSERINELAFKYANSCDFELMDALGDLNLSPRSVEEEVRRE